MTQTFHLETDKIPMTFPLRCQGFIRLAGDTGNEPGEPSAFPSHAKECHCDSTGWHTECLQIHCFYLHGVPDGWALPHWTVQRVDNTLIIFHIIQSVFSLPVWCCRKVQPNTFKYLQILQNVWKLHLTFYLFVHYSRVVVALQSQPTIWQYFSLIDISPLYPIRGSWKTIVVMEVLNISWGDQNQAAFSTT